MTMALRTANVVNIPPIDKDSARKRILAKVPEYRHNTASAGDLGKQLIGYYTMALPRPSADEPLDEAALVASSLLNLNESGDYQQAAVLVFDRLTDLYASRKLAECDSLLEKVDSRRLHLAILLALLKGTARLATDSVPSRAALLETVKQRIQAERPPAEASAIISRLR